MTAISFRWGISILDEGHVPVYNFMLRHYADAGVTRDEFLCILHLAAYHYESKNGQSKPALETIAEEMGYKHKNSVYRLIKSLRDKKLLVVTQRKGKTSVYNLGPFSKRMLDLWNQSQEPEEGVTPEGDTSITLGCDGVSHPSVTEEEEKKKNSRKDDAPKAGAAPPPVQPHIDKLRAEKVNLGATIKDYGSLICNDDFDYRDASRLLRVAGGGKGGAEKVLLALAEARLRVREPTKQNIVDYAHQHVKNSKVDKGDPDDVKRRTVARREERTDQ